LKQTVVEPLKADTEFSNEPGIVMHKFVTCISCWSLCTKTFLHKAV